MPVYVSLLRGVNLGGHNKVSMGELRAVYEELGCSDVTTYINSGNVVFRAPRLPSRERVGAALEARFGFRPAVITRTAAELRAVAEANPLAPLPPEKLAVVFLEHEPRHDAVLPDVPERIAVGKRELYIFYPDGMGRAKLTPKMLDKVAGGSGTARNWNTVRKLLELAEALEATRVRRA